MSFIRARSVFISDTHLGTYGSQAEKIIELLDSISVEKLYLVGDIIDGWQLQSKWYWPETHSFVLEKIIKISENGTKVFYISGNHDDFLRKIGNFKLGGIIFCNEVTHITPDNKKFLVIHGDKYDQVIAKAPWVAYILDALYNFFQFVNRKLNIFLKFFGFKYFSVIDILKANIKSVSNFICHFEFEVLKDIKERKFDGVICGHIHHAQNKKIRGIQYMNCGDWVDSCTALIEDLNGQIKILDWKNQKIKNTHFTFIETMGV